jgi:HK97 gp10 family phage protein
VSIVTTVVFDNLPALNKQATAMAVQAVKKAAFDIEEHAKTIVPVDTGFLKNSIATQVGADGLHSPRGSSSHQHSPANDLTAYVGAHAEYAANVEYGLGQRPQPYLRPAVERVRPAFIEAMKQIAKM